MVGGSQQQVPAMMAVPASAKRDSNASEDKAEKDGHTSKRRRIAPTVVGNLAK